MKTTPSKTSQITAILAEEIRSGKFKSGEKLPSLRELGRRFGVSTMVLYQAACKLEQMGLLLRGPRSGLFIPENHHQSELCAFITSVSVGYMDNYYEAFLKTCSDAGAISMVTSGYLNNLEGMLEKKPLRVFVDVGSKNFSFNEISRLTKGFNTIFCNRFEFPHVLPESGVLTDWIYITEMTLRHFLAAGHRKILFVSHNRIFPEYKRLEMEEAGKRVGLTFDSPEFQWCSGSDFQDNPERIVRILRNDPPTAIFARGDYLLNDFIRKAKLYFPGIPEIEMCGAFDTYISNQPGQEFLSWHWNWDDFWKQVFAHKGQGVEYYRPVLPEQAGAWNK